MAALVMKSEDGSLPKEAERDLDAGWDAFGSVESVDRARRLLVG